jgi:hypothetical protein
MPGGIQPGTCATSKESTLSEARQVDIVENVISSRGEDWRIEKSILIEDILGYLGEYSILKNGKSQAYYADGGFVYYKNKLVGVCENKYQDTVKNACERTCRYLMFLKPEQMFVSCEGPGFIKINGGGSTGPVIDLLRHAGACVLENEKDESAYIFKLNQWLDSLVRFV